MKLEKAEYNFKVLSPHLSCGKEACKPKHFVYLHQLKVPNQCQGEHILHFLKYTRQQWCHFYFCLLGSKTSITM